jgi:PhnB protein
VSRGELGPIFHYGGTPLARDVPADWSDKVMHGSLRLGGQVLMGGDVAPDRYEVPKAFRYRSRSKARRTRSASFTNWPGRRRGRAAGENVLAERFGMLVDRFGIPWLINCEGTGQSE